MFETNLTLDLEWMYNISCHLQGFKKVHGRNVYNCRCPICGDSKRKKRIARFYFYEKKGSLNTHCKNCDFSGSFFTFMREAFPTQFEQYKRDLVLSRLKGKKDTKAPQPEREVEEKRTVSIKGCVPMLSLPKSHHAYRYLKEERMLDDDSISRLMYSENFKVTAESISYDELSEGFPTDSRIVIPFYSEKGEIEMVQARSLKQDATLRYISIKSDPDVDKVYGKERIDKSKTVYCVEGPFDSMFIDNCIATCDSSLLRAKADVYIFDNQPRNKEIVALMKEAIDAGKNIVIWPNSPNNKLDINDMIKMGLTKEELMQVIQKRTFHSIRATLELNTWKRI